MNRVNQSLGLKSARTDIRMPLYFVQQLKKKMFAKNTPRYLQKIQVQVMWTNFSKYQNLCQFIYSDPKKDKSGGGKILILIFIDTTKHKNISYYTHWMYQVVSSG
jgi:hypothetical protein